MQLNNRILGLFGRTPTNTSPLFSKDINNQKETSYAKGHSEETNKTTTKKQIAHGGEAPPLFGWALAKIRTPKADKTADLSPYKQSVQGEAAPLFGWMSRASSSQHAVNTTSSLLPPPVPPRINQQVPHQEQDARPIPLPRTKLPEKAANELRLPPTLPPKLHEAKAMTHDAELNLRPPPIPPKPRLAASSAASQAHTQRFNQLPPYSMTLAHTQSLSNRTQQPLTAADTNPTVQLTSRPIPKPRTKIPGKSQSLPASHSDLPQQIQQQRARPPIAPKPSSILSSGATRFVRQNPVSHENYPHSSSLPQMRDSVKREDPPPVLARPTITNHAAPKASQGEPIYDEPWKSIF